MASNRHRTDDRNLQHVHIDQPFYPTITDLTIQPVAGISDGFNASIQPIPFEFDDPPPSYESLQHNRNFDTPIYTINNTDGKLNNNGQVAGANPVILQDFTNAPPTSIGTNYM